MSSAISACEKGKQWGEALGLLQEMVHQLLTPDVVSLNAAISACEKGKQSEGPHFRPTAPAAPAPRELLVAGTQHP